ncbi:MAG: hydroxymethylbilane synthase [Austwickia sp.]|jgi:hydroxymethylbilane synthase|nr:MAG: hydroxymethylbilane synthase [Austwickia sp.]
MTAPAQPLRLATRRSELATTQAGWVADLLRSAGHDVDLVTIVTEGDVSAAPLTQIGGTGVFASAIRRALHDGRADLAVHSLKDLPSAPEPGLVIAAVPEREDPRDALVARDGLTLWTLPPGARVGTGSPRRAAQLLAAREDLVVVPIRGNVPTRLAQVSSGALDAVVLARAGLARLGRLEAVTEVLDLADMLPAAGQGALAIECRADRSDVLGVVQPVADPAADAAVRAERALLAALEAGCTAPVGAHAQIAQSPTGIILQLSAFVGTADGREHLRRSHAGSPLDPEGIGAELARRLLDEGAARFTGG